MAIIKCKCGGTTGVIESGRSNQREGHRKRKCKKCGIRFTTYEIREEESSVTHEELGRLEEAIKEDLNQAMEDMEGAISKSFNYFKARTHE